jgi:hypothetical protein
MNIQLMQTDHNNEWERFSILITLYLVGHSRQWMTRTEVTRRLSADRKKADLAAAPSNLLHCSPLRTVSSVVVCIWS